MTPGCLCGKCSDECKRARQMRKSFGVGEFAGIWNGGAGGLLNSVRARMTPDEVRQLASDFRQTWPEVGTWHDSIMRNPFRMPRPKLTLIQGGLK